jgi:hypothetical protein
LNIISLSRGSGGYPLSVREQRLPRFAERIEIVANKWRALAGRSLADRLHCPLVELAIPMNGTGS